MKYRAHRSTVVTFPQVEELARDDNGAWQYTYSGKALASKAPHGSDCPCLMCGDFRRATGHRAIDPAPELSRIARRILERAAYRDRVRISLAPGVRVSVGPTLISSAGVGAILGIASAVYVITGGVW